MDPDVHHDPAARAERLRSDYERELQREGWSIRAVAGPYGGRIAAMAENRDVSGL